MAILDLQTIQPLDDERGTYGSTSGGGSGSSLTGCPGKSSLSVTGC